jgi:vacuolar-type H+-ATPase subunit H
MAVQEARDQASRILASAEAQAQSILADAEDRGRRTLEDTIAECRAELSRLETTRSQAQQDVESLQRWLDEHKAHLQESLSDAMAAVDRAGILWPAPSTRPLDGVSAGISPRLTAAVPPPPEPVAAPVPPPEPPLAADNLAWSAADDIKLDVRDSSSLQQAPPSARREAERVIDDPDQQALDDFFEDNEDFDDDRRFGGRLRRRR